MTSVKNALKNIYSLKHMVKLYAHYYVQAAKLR